MFNIYIELNILVFFLFLKGRRQDLCPIPALFYCKSRRCRTSKTSFNELLYSVSYYGYLHRTGVALNSIDRSDGRVDRA